MSSDRYLLFLFWGGLLVLLTSLLAIAVFVLVLPALAKEADPPGIVTEQDCQALIRNELRQMPVDGIRYKPAGEETSYPSWSFTGITGVTRTLKWLRAEFDLVQVYFRRAGSDWNGDLDDWDGQEIAYAWIAYGVHTPDGRYLTSEGLPPFSRTKGVHGLCNRQRAVCYLSGLQLLWPGILFLLPG